MASPDVVGDQLAAAGFTDVAFERSDAAIDMGDSLDDAVAFALDMGPAGEVVRLAGPAAVPRRASLEAAVREALACYVRAEGVRAPTSAWIVTARVR
jgi:hypothetical protein